MSECKKCTKCRQLYPLTSYYKFKNGEQSETCKYCERQGRDVYEPETYIALFRKYDIPFIKGVWYTKIEYMEEGGRERADIQNSVFGKYLATMYLKGYRPFGFDDSDVLNKHWSV